MELSIYMLRERHKKSIITIFLCLLCLLFFGGISYAEKEGNNDSDRQDSESLDRNQEEPKDTRHQLEITFSYDYLSPYRVYNSWETARIKFSSRLQEDFLYFLELDPFFRKEGDGILGVIGAYKDWTRYLYTYTALSSGSKTDYLPKFRVDHDLNFKLGKGQHIVWTAGISYIDYHDAHQDLLLSTGFTLYWKDWIGGYRIFNNHSYPGNNISYTHLVTVGYGREKWQWTQLDVYIGNEAYLATYAYLSEKVDEQFLNVILTHKHWITQNWGIVGNISYFDLWENYEKYGFTLGFFVEF